MMAFQMSLLYFQMMVSSILSAVNDRMTFVHNAVGGRREQVVIKINNYIIHINRKFAYFS